MHYGEDEILSQIQSTDIFTVTLVKSDSAWNPTTTSGRPIYGPAKITYTRYVDGGIHCQIDEISVDNGVGLSASDIDSNLKIGTIKVRNGTGVVL